MSKPPKKSSGTFPVTRRRPPVPETLLDLDRLFPHDEACRRYLATLRWPGGSSCPWCAEPTSEMSSRALIRCGACGMVSSPVTCTVLDSTVVERGPVSLRGWFRGLWEITGAEAGADPSRLGLVLGLDEASTWSWLDAVRDIYRAAWGERLAGVVELATVLVEVPAHDGRISRALIAVAVEVRNDGSGRVRAELLERLEPALVAEFVERAVSPGSCIRTGPWEGFAAVRRRGYGHLPARRSEDAEMPHAEELASILRVWLWSNRQATAPHLPYYLDEFVFRFNAGLRYRRGDRGGLFLELLRVAVDDTASGRRRTA